MLIIWHGSLLIGYKILCKWLNELSICYSYHWICKWYLYIYALKRMSIGRGWLSHTSNCPNQCVYELGWDMVY